MTAEQVQRLAEEIVNKVGHVPQSPSSYVHSVTVVVELLNAALAAAAQPPAKEQK